MFTPPYRVEGTAVFGTETFLVFDATDQLVATSFDETAAQNIAAMLNPLYAEALAASLLACFRLELERELGRPLAGVALDAVLLLEDLCEWFGFSTGQKAVVMGGAPTKAEARIQNVDVARAEAVEVAEMAE